MMDYLIYFGIFLTIYTIVLYFGMNYTNMLFWKATWVPCDVPDFIIGDLEGLSRSRKLASALRETYKKYKSKMGSFCGFFMSARPVALVTDLDLAYNILVRDADKFDDRGSYHNKNDDAFAENLWNLEAAEWSVLRRKLAPLFTSEKLKTIFPLIVKIGDELKKQFAAADENEIIIEIHDLCQRYITDVIANCILGLQVNSLQDPSSEFRLFTKKYAMKSCSTWTYTLMQWKPELARRWHLTQTFDKVRDFYYRVIGGTIVEREKKKYKRNDLMTRLIELKNAKVKANRLSLDEIIVNSALFFEAGYEPSASILTYAFFELGLEQLVQNKLRREITDVLKRHNGKLTYEAMEEMKYLDMVILETLRKYCIYPYIERVANDDYITNVEDFIIFKDTKVVIPIEAIHHDSDYNERPTAFIPTRFETEKLQSRHPCACLPFGAGPRNCIGMRFAKLMIGVALIALLSEYKFDLSSKCTLVMESPKDRVLLRPEKEVKMCVQKLQT